MSKSTADIDKAATTVSVTTAEESATSTLGNTATETSLATDTPIPTASPHSKKSVLSPLKTYLASCALRIYGS